jgi:hypothetical protein
MEDMTDCIELSDLWKITYFGVRSALHLPVGLSKGDGTCNV